MSKDRLTKGKARMATTKIFVFEHSLPRTIFTINTTHS